MFAGHVELQTVEQTTAEADDRRDEDLASFPDNLHICCIDDSEPARRLLHFNLMKWGRTENVHIYGRDQMEAESFVRMTLRRGDVAILDQHLEYGGDNNLLGTGVCVRAHVCKRARGLLVCLQSPHTLPSGGSFISALTFHPHCTNCQRVNFL